MKVVYKELNVNNYIIRGLYTKPDVISKGLAVLLHGYTGHKNENGHIFKQLAAKLSEIGISSLRFDYMGSGDSDGNFSDQTFDTVRNDALAAIEEGYKLNNNKPIILIGFSMGGATAARVSLKVKDKITKLILMSPAANMPQILENTFKLHKLINNKYVDLGGYLVSDDFLKSFQNVNLYEGLEIFDKPVLITQGSADLSVPVEVSKKYTEIYRNSKYVLINGASHCYTKIEYREELFKYILEFISK